MKTLTQYKSKVKNLFFDYLQGTISAKELKTELKVVEQYHKDLIQDKYSDKELWLKFENITYSIDEIYSDCLAEGNNKKFLEEQINESLKLDNDLEIFYS